MTTTRTGSPEDLAAARAGAVLGELTPAVVRLTGRDARRFCNGMFTNNVRDLVLGGANRHAMVDDRGRIGGFLDLHCEADDTFLAVLDGVDVDAFEARYARFIVFDDVELEPVAGLAWWTLQGPQADAVARAAELPVPTPGTWAEADGVRSWHRRRSGAGGLDLLFPAAQAEAIVARLEGAGARRIGAGALEVLRVAAGDPVFPQDTTEKGLPHELGLRDVLLHFEKGCYLGQESINRIDVMGQVRRHLAAVRVRGATPPDGAEVHVDKRVGLLTSVVELPGGDSLALAILREPTHETGTRVRIEGDGGPWDGEVLALPVEV